MKTRLGGHENYEVHRDQFDDGSVVSHVALDAHNAEGLLREEAALRALSGTGFAPELLASATDELPSTLYETDLGDTETTYTDGEALRHSMVWLLASIRAAGLRHGDLTSANLILRDNAVRAIDWQESHRLDEPAPQKQPWTDSWLLMRTLRDLPDRNGIADTPRIARRWMAVLEDLDAMRHSDQNPLPLKGRDFMDLGCYTGDFVALAAAEGMHAHGLDQGGFRTGENSIEIGHQRWSDWPWDLIGGSLTLTRQDLFDMPQPLQLDVAMCFSAWIYMVEQRGQEAALSWLAAQIANSTVLYFETQLAGDGPGPDWMPDDAACESMLRSLGGDPRPIATIPVTGRDAARTVWAVR